MINILFSYYYLSLMLRSLTISAIIYMIYSIIKILGTQKTWYYSLKSAISTDLMLSM